MAPHVGRARGSTVECLEGACFGGGSAVDWLLWQRGREGEKTRRREDERKTEERENCPKCSVWPFNSGRLFRFRH